jgi:hypothetical protein
MVFRTDLEHRWQHSAAATPELHGHGHREVWLPETLDDDDAYGSMRNSAIVIALHRICALGVCCGREDPSPHFGTEAEFALTEPSAPWWNCNCVESVRQNGSPIFPQQAP